MQAAMAQYQVADKEANAKMLDAQTKQAAAQAKVQLDAQKLQLDAQKLRLEASRPQGGLAPQTDDRELAIKAADVAAKAKEIEFKVRHAQMENENRDLDRRADIEIAAMKEKSNHVQHALKLASDLQKQREQHLHERGLHLVPKPVQQ